MKDIMDRMMEPVKRILHDNNLTPKDIEHILLVGGSTRIRCVKDRIEEFFGENSVHSNDNVDESIA